MTPFMLAVSGRAYPAAITVLEAAQKMAKGKLISQHSAYCCKLIFHLKGDCYGHKHVRKCQLFVPSIMHIYSMHVLWCGVVLRQRIGERKKEQRFA